MASLVNCRILEEDQEVSVSVTSGVNDIATQTLTIVPEEGYVIDESLFTDYTALADAPGIDLPVTFSNVGTGWEVGNKVAVTIDLNDSYSITEDTTLTIDIGGEAKKIAENKVFVCLVEDISNHPNVTYVFEANSGVTYEKVTAADGSDDLGNHGGASLGAIANGNNDVFHTFIVEVEQDIEKPLGTITVTASSGDSDIISYFSGNQPYLVHDPTFAWNYDNPIRLSDPEVTTVQTLIGDVETQYKYKIFYTEPEQLDYDHASLLTGTGAFNYDPNRLAIHKAYAKVEQTSARPVGVSTQIHDVSVTFEDHAPFNDIPVGGIIEGNGSVIEIKGDKGSQFTITVKELVETNIDISIGGDGVVGYDKPITSIDADYSGGEMTVVDASGTLEIPEKGWISFDFPTISRYTGSGYRSFEVEVKALNATTISEKANTTDQGEIIDAGKQNAKLKNVYHQFSNVNITYTATKNSGWAYTADAYSAVSTGQGYRVFGGPDDGSVKTGRPGIRIEDESYRRQMKHQTTFDISSKVTYIAQWRVKVVGGSGAFSFTNNVVEEKDKKGNGTGYYTFDKKNFAASIDPDINKDKSEIANIRVYIGEGVADSSGDANQFATVTFIALPHSFGRLSQIYTLDLEKIFKYS
jgi:hypothetical protein